MASVATASSPYSSLKRRSPSPLDCQSLQSSLKRVRLSCSPGELRLQRDVRSLPSAGWEMIAADRWHHGETNVQLIQQDPLRLKLHFPTINSSMWMQFPRMYPHQPPVISRIDGNLWMEQIVVEESPPSVPPGSVQPCVCGTTLVYNQWSPVTSLADLVEFLIDSGLSARPLEADDGMMDDAEENHAPASSSSRTGFMEEHKMDDATGSRGRSVSVQNLNGGWRGGGKVNAAPDVAFPLICLAPNRFDVGYGKYQDTYANASSRNAMEM